MTLQSFARLYLDRRRRLPSYRAMGIVGWLVAQLVVIALHRAAGAHLGDVFLVSVVAVLSFFLGLRISHLLFGRERIVFYEHALLALAASALALRAAHRPVAPGLDLVMLGVATFLAFGRLGCLMVGCCHGRPVRWGIRYTDEHAGAGFPAHLIGVPLFPVQLADSALSAGLAVAAAVLASRGHAPGAPAALWLAGYGAGRSVLELLRGDDARPHLIGLSEAQWTAICVAWGIVFLHALTPVTVGYAVALTAFGAVRVSLRAR